ncbi:hypothetical protein Fcan01_07247 [Folsomia candida]|uniref:Uncharacterized protein n=1 Tax=Folsomia candida TaxID=158441 RepID=A0A226EMG8_FOLCA|nr:hypothetical protein Fcan01_07247 [Folsomia candida]
MSDPVTKANLDDLQQLVIIFGGALVGLVIIAIVLVVISLVSVSRIFKRLKDISFVTKNTRLDIRKVLETVETAVKRNPALLIDDDDGSERVSPIFTRRMFTPSPLPFDLSVLRESGEFEYGRGRTTSSTSSNVKSVPVTPSSNSRKVKGPAVPPRRAHSFYGDY